ncbi:hypothetical protein GCM10009539_52690 [Cryptosporangium japonicum]|uniref:Uncharacterized protein n=1 Tax=Cryptosporangium japonicum TaxID=80872 RepID=A0ABN0UT28_9ACTN
MTVGEERVQPDRAPGEEAERQESDVEEAGAGDDDADEADTAPATAGGVEEDRCVGGEFITDRFETLRDVGGGDRIHGFESNDCLERADFTLSKGRSGGYPDRFPRQYPLSPDKTEMA